MKSTPHIALISPSATRPGFIPRFFRFPPLNLALLAALAPDYQYRIIDENVRSIDHGLREVQEADIIGITAMTAQAPRAYELADRFRRMGKTVVMGGMHASAVPDEALEHVDAVVVGEAEGIWPKLLQDWQQDRLHAVYRNRTFPDLSGLPIPRRDLLKRGDYPPLNTLHVSRGCPLQCSFCAVHKFFGGKYRFRPVPEVIEEIRGMIESDHMSLGRRVLAWAWNKASANPFAFLDDNIFGRKEYARRLFEALVPLGILWGAQASVNIAAPENEDLLALAAKSGCRFLFVGFESIDQASLDEARKKVNKPAAYERAVELFHKYGISVLGAFVFGFDGDDPGTFQRTVDFAQRIKLDVAQFTVLTPLPGTPLRAELVQRGRITVRDWSGYDFRHCVFQPAGMSATKLEEGEEWAWREFYSWSSILSRAPSVRHWQRLVVHIVSNIGFRLLRPERPTLERPDNRGQGHKKMGRDSLSIGG